MPPSPAPRIPQSREMKAEKHYDEKHDDLALFNEVQSKQRDNFLLQSTYDLNIFSTKLKQVSPGKASDLLNAVEKNDYEWLITPPESPLFSFLDDGAPALDHELLSNLRSQHVPVSRSSVVEKSYTSARRSPSPRCLSPSCSSRRQSPSPRKSTPAAKSGVLTPTRLSTGSANASQSRRTGTSPVKTSVDYSVSPNIKAWQLNIPGFSSEVPPNLRTSLGCRPGLSVRCSSASKCDSRNGRQSISPAASKSLSSFRSNERKESISCRKVSVISSGDDNAYSPLSKTLSCSDTLVQRRIRSLPNNRPLGLSKKSVNSFAGSHPKRPFDVVLRQVDKEGSRNMFRPLFSSVPSSALCAGKESTRTCSPKSRKSSFPTSSNGTLGRSIIGSLGTEGEDNQDDTSQDFSKTQAGGGGKVFSADQPNAAYKEADDRNPGVNDLFTVLSHVGAVEVAMDGASGRKLCSECYIRCHLIELDVLGDQQLCPDCRNAEANPYSFLPVGRATVNAVPGVTVSEQSASAMEMDYAANIVDKGQDSSYVPCKKDPAMSNRKPKLPVGDNSIHNQKQLVDSYGISKLLKRSSSVQGHIVPSRSYKTSNTSYDDVSYLRDSLTSLRSSIGAHLNWKPSVSKPDMEHHLCEEIGKSQFSSVFRFPCMMPCSSEGGIEVINLRRNSEVRTQGQSLASEHIEAESKTAATEEPTVLEEASEWTRNPKDSTNAETSTPNLQFCCQDAPQRSSFDMIDAVVATQLGTLDTTSELERSFDMVPAELHHGLVSTNSKNVLIECVGKVPEIQDDHVETPDVSIAAITEAPTTTVPEGKQGSRNRAQEITTDVILLCCSTFHDITNHAKNRDICPDGVPSKITSGRHSSKIHKSQHRRLEAEAKSPACIDWSTVTPKLDSKCSCTIM